MKRDAETDFLRDVGFLILRLPRSLRNELAAKYHGVAPKETEMAARTAALFLWEGLIRRGWKLTPPGPAEPHQDNQDAMEPGRKPVV